MTRATSVQNGISSSMSPRLPPPAPAMAGRRAAVGPGEPKSPPPTRRRRAAPAAAAAVQHGQRRVEALQHDLGRVAFSRRPCPAICGSAARPRCKPSGPSSDTARRPWQRLSLKITTRCHSVFSLRSPVALSRQLSEVAIAQIDDRPPVLGARGFPGPPRDCRPE